MKGSDGARGEGREGRGEEKRGGKGRGGKGGFPKSPSLKNPRSATAKLYLPAELEEMPGSVWTAETPAPNSKERGRHK